MPHDIAEQTNNLRAAYPDTAVGFVKAADGTVDRSRIAGHLVIFTGPEHRDLYGEYFTRSTEYALERWPVKPLMYQHGFDTVLRDLPIGMLDTLKMDGVGLWAEAQLDMHHEYLEQLQYLIDQGVLGWSSGAFPQGVQVDAEGEIKRWPIIEGSLTPTPAEPLTVGDITYQTPPTVRRVGGGWVYDTTRDELLKAYKSAGLTVPDLLDPHSASEGEADEEQAEEGTPSRALTSHPIESPVEDHLMPDTQGLTREQALDLFRSMRQEEQAAAEQAALEAKAARADTLEQENAELRAKVAPDSEPARRLPGRTTEPEDLNDPAANPNKVMRITVGSKFDHADPVDLAYGLAFMQALNQHDRGKGHVSEQYARALAEKAWNAGYRPVKADGTPFKTGDELAHSTQTNYGDEWVPDLWSSELWRKARVENQILPLFRLIEMPSNPFELPIEANDPTVYFVPETTDEAQLTIAGSGAAIPDSKVGSGKVQLSAKKLGLRVGFSTELVEDSLIPILPMYREQAMNAMADAIDHLLLNGDTESGATGNINSDDGAPAATTKYMAFNGLRKLPLVTTTAQAVDAAGAPTLASLRSARFTLPVRYSLQPKKLAWIVDGASYGRLLGLNEVVTIDKYGAGATVLTGEIGQVDGVPVITSAEMSLTMADGKVNSTGNTKGQALCVYRPGWVVGYRRRVAAEVVRVPYYDAYQMVATVRLAFVNFDAYVASALYDVTV